MLATWAASVGPREVVLGDGPPPRIPLGESSSAPDVEIPGKNEPVAPPVREEDPAAWVDVLVAAVKLLLGLLALIALITAMRRIRSPKRASRTPSTDTTVDFEVLDPQRAVQAMASDATAQWELLTSGTPRNGVVACWHRFEVQASSIGLAREPWETSSEFALRLLDLVDADPAAVRDLSALYREARYSDHEIDEASRERARAALDVIHRGLRRRLGEWLGSAR